MIEFWICIAAALIVLMFARVGIYFGVFYEVTSTLFLFWAMLVALRFWYPLTSFLAPWFNGETGYAAFVAYWILFLVGSVPLIALTSRVSEGSTPRYPRAFDTVVGFVFGGLSAAIVVCMVMTSLSSIAPKVWPDYQREHLILPIDRVSITVYQAIEENWMHVARSDPAHTRFPTFKKTDVDDLGVSWQ